MAVSPRLQKAKKDEQALKKRNITHAASEPPSKEVSLTLQEIINGVNASDPDICFQTTQAARKMLFRERNPPLKLIIEAGFIPRLVQFLKSSRHLCLQFEAAWVLTNTASGTGEQTRAVVEGGGVQPLMELLSSLHMTVCEQAVCALGNTAGDDPKPRDVIISSKAVPHLLALVLSTTQITFLRNIMWNLSNLSPNKNPYPCKQAMKQMLLHPPPVAPRQQRRGRRRRCTAEALPRAGLAGARWPAPSLGLPPAAGGRLRGSGDRAQRTPPTPPVQTGEQQHPIEDLGHQEVN
ncbi:Importin subunit alpha-8 [Manis javanica]|nr:Importin subunit alpha-8 [Manis javanica]